MNQKPGVFGYKLGNTQIFREDGSVQRVTVIEAGPITVLGKRTPEKDGYSALIFGLTERKPKHTSKARAGQYAKKEGKKALFADANTTPKRVVREIRVPADYAAKFEAGQTLKLEEMFTPGQYVDAQGKTRGRGFTGVVRRWAMAGFVQTHGTHEYRRHGGSIGTNMTPGRTLPNLKMPGHYGDEKLSILNLKIAKVIPEKNLILVEGAVPGAKGSLVLIRHAVKDHKKS